MDYNKQWQIRKVLFACLLFVYSANGYGEVVGNWQVKYEGFNDLKKEKLHIQSDEVQEQEQVISIYNVENQKAEKEFYFAIQILDTRYASVKAENIKSSEFVTNGNWSGTIDVIGKHYGYTTLYVALFYQGDDNVPEEVERSQEELSIAVERSHAVDERIFTYVAGGVVMLMFLNLGTVLDLQRLLALVRMPIGLLIGFLNCYLLMPALGLAFGYLLFINDKALHLALFYTALAPSGGLANICIIFLKGNLNLSVATSTINGLLALGLMPLWIMLFARVVYNEEQQLVVPYVALAIGAVAVIVALALGVLLRLFIPHTTLFIFRFLKPVSMVLSLCLIAVTVGMNIFVFAQYTWQVFIASLFLPLIGYWSIVGLSRFLGRRTPTDALTLGIDACVLNMSLPIVLLQYSLPQPQLDLVLVVPIASSLTSLLLVALFYGVRRWCGWHKHHDHDAFSIKKILIENEVSVAQTPNVIESQLPEDK